MSMPGYPSNPYDEAAMAAATDQTNPNFDGWYHNQIQFTANQQQQNQQQQTAYQNQIGQQVQPPLPQGWEEKLDAQSGRMYYVDHERQITTWERPSMTGGLAAMGMSGTVVGGSNSNSTAGAIALNNINAAAQGNNSQVNDIMDQAANNLNKYESVNNDGTTTNTMDGTGTQNEWNYPNNTTEGGGENEANQEGAVEEGGDATAPATIPPPAFDGGYPNQGDGENENNEVTDEMLTKQLKKRNVTFNVGGIASARARQYTEKWDKNVEELKAFKEAHGHTNVPQKEGSLGRWVNNQRQFYARFNKGQKSSLTEERIKALDEIGFAWTMKGVRKQQISSSPKDKNQPGAKTKSEPKPQIIRKSKKQRVSKKADKVSTSNTDANIISTKMLDDGTQVIESNEKVKHADGSVAEIVTEESTQKRMVRLPDGSRVLETTTKIVTTTIERIVLPPLPPVEVEDEVLKEEETMPKLEAEAEGEESKQPSEAEKDELQTAVEENTGDKSESTQIKSDEAMPKGETEVDDVVVKDPGTTTAASADESMADKTADNSGDGASSHLEEKASDATELAMV